MAVTTPVFFIHFCVMHVNPGWDSLKQKLTCCAVKSCILRCFFIGTTIYVYIIYINMAYYSIYLMYLFSFACWQVVLMNLPLKMKLVMGMDGVPGASNPKSEAQVTPKRRKWPTSILAIVSP